MDCNETRRLLEADTDGELDLVRHLALEAHLRTCPDCAKQAEALRIRRGALRDNLPRFAAPPQLAGKIHAALRAESALQPSAASVSSRRSILRWPVWNLAGLAAMFALVLAAGFTWGETQARTTHLFDEAFSEHIRSLQADHLTDVASSDQHTVKPWFVGRLDFSPPVIDLASLGFPLTGGRLDHLDDHSTAALVYHRRQHPINLFIWPNRVAKTPLRRMERSGYRAESWSQAGFNFLAISEIPADELARFAEALRAQL